MKKTDKNYIAEATGAEIVATAADGMYSEVTSVVIDSRNVDGAGCLFFAIIGERVDAHIFLDDVRNRGCHNVVVSNKESALKIAAYGDMNVFLVKDTTRALMDLAKKYMDDWPELKRIGVTGSVGKTGTKEFIYSVLSSKYKTQKTPGNFNSSYGVPLTVFGFDQDAEIAVIEMGVGSDSKMDDLVEIVKPENAAITIIGSSHLEIFGTHENLADEKLSIVKKFGNDSTLVINSDCEILKQGVERNHISESCRVITVGTESSCDYYVHDICDMGVHGVKCNLSVKRNGADFDGQTGCEVLRLSVPGVHNLINAAEAVAIGGLYGVTLHDAVASLADTEFIGKRLDVSESGGITFINDTYNASPESMKAGIDVLMASEASRHIAVLGDMFELGTDSKALHGEVGRYAVEKGVDILIVIGINAEVMVEGARSAFFENRTAEIFSFNTKEEAAASINEFKLPGDMYLVKASRVMEFEKLVEEIKK